MILFMDTETTGFFKHHLPVDDPSQPYLVQLAAQLCEDTGDIVSSFSLIIDPGLADSWQGRINVTIPKAASDVHGITDEIALRFGAPLGLALSVFAYLYRSADMIAAHNIEFDKGIMEAAIARNYGKVRPLTKPVFCTMKEATPVMNLPPTDRMLAAGIFKAKSPKLTECVERFFGESFDDAHDAMADVAACRRVYFHLKSMEKS